MPVVSWLSLSAGTASHTLPVPRSTPMSISSALFHFGLPTLSNSIFNKIIQPTHLNFVITFPLALIVVRFTKGTILCYCSFSILSFINCNFTHHVYGNPPLPEWEQYYAIVHFPFYHLSIAKTQKLKAFCQRVEKPILKSLC